MQNKKILAIIPARGGSKRIPRKNIKDFLGKPIIAYSIETALKSGLFDEVMVSTDDQEIAEVAKKYGAKVPFLRSEKNSDDHSSTADVIEEVLNEYQKKSKNFDVFCCIYPTAPFINEDTLKKCYELMEKGKYDSVFPIVKFSYPIQRGLKMTGSKVEMIWPENYNKRSQDIESAYHDSGQFYWLRTDKFLQEKKVYLDNSGAIVLDNLMVQDIDNLEDWKMAEFKYQFIDQNKK
ncbi:MAG: pseudaminic acid cytidylyltransferase [Patescibacteria group bacterium]